MRRVLAMPLCVFFNRFLHPFLNVCLSGSVFVVVVVVVYFESATEYSP